MQILSLNFLLYSLGGVWRPIEWSSKWSKLLYSALTCLTIYVLNFSVFTQFMDIILIVDNMDDFATTSLIFLSAVSAFCKATTAVTRRDKIMTLLKILQEEPCKARDEEENVIQAKYNRIIRSCSMSYMFLASFSATGATIGEVITALQGQLPYRAWIPYDYTSFFLFWLTSIQEMLALIFGTFINIATETIVFGFCLYTCAQLEILIYRLQRVAESYDSKEIYENSWNAALKKTGRLSQHIYHHLCIIRFAEMVNETFSQVLFVQFFASILVLCSTVYYLTSHMTIADFVTLAVYTFCMFVQILVYCWAGNEVMLKSTGLSEAIYQLDWVLMTTAEQKDLLMIMKRSTRPIKFTSSFLVTLSLDSYANMLKTSYSAFNVLQHS